MKNEEKEQFATKWQGKSKVINLFLQTVSQRGCKHGGMAREILKYEDCLRTFLSKEDVEPTNNLTERTLRHAVTMRKTSYGLRSEVGLRFIERGMSIRQTLVLQKHNFFDFLYQLMLGHSQPLLPALPVTLKARHVLTP